MNRLVCRVKVTDRIGGSFHAYDVRVEANEHGLLTYVAINARGIPVALSFMGVKESELPKSFEEAGGKNYKVLETLERAIGSGYSIDYKWTETEPGN